MDLFHLIDDAQAILRIRSQVYRQAKVYRRGDQVFAAWGGGFIRLLPGGGTTMPHTSWLDLEGPGIAFGNNRHPKFRGAADEAAA